MNKSSPQLTDAVLGNSDALDAVLRSFDFATSFDDVIGCSDESLATRTASTSRK